MPLTNSLLDNIRRDFPDIILKEGAYFAWSPHEKVIYYAPDEDSADELLLHELSHHLLSHSDYPKDVALLNMESTAWEKARELSVAYDVTVSNDTVESHLDTYRDWLHARSTCPSCTATGYQSGKSEYSCPACTGKWRVNEARLCGLRRYKI